MSHWSQENYSALQCTLWPWLLLCIVSPKEPPSLIHCKWNVLRTLVHCQGRQCNRPTTRVLINHNMLLALRHRTFPIAACSGGTFCCIYSREGWAKDFKFKMEAPLLWEVQGQTAIGECNWHDFIVYILCCISVKHIHYVCGRQNYCPSSRNLGTNA